MFIIKFLCHNCGGRWETEFERRFEVDEGSNGVYVRSPHCTLAVDCKECYHVECPTCGLQKRISVTSRSPKAVTA